MRKIRMIGGTDTHEIHQHVMTRNFWEFYLLDDNWDSPVRSALVMGMEVEVGDVSIEEIAPYVVSSTTDLNGIMPPTGYEWADGKEAA